MSAEAPLRLYISTLTRPYTIPYRRAQTFDDFRTTANRILLSCIETGELQPNSDENVPQPGNWKVVEETGAIISSVLWQDLVVPGGTYCLVPRQEIATATSMRASQSQSSSAATDSTSRSTTAGSSVSSGSPIISGSSEVRSVSYRDALSTAVVGAGRPVGGGGYISYFGGSDAGTDNGVRLNSETPPPPPTPPKRDEQVTPLTRPLITSGSPWSAVVANGLAPQNASNAGGSNHGSDWTVVQARKPIPQPTKPLVQIKVWKNETVPSTARSYTVPPTISVGEFIERIGGREGCRVQEMKRVREGFLPGLTYMWGTQKSIEDVGWADRKRGTVGVYLHMPPRFD